MQFIIRDNGVDEIIIDIPEIDKQIVEHYVIDFKEWIKEGPVNFVTGKPEARRKALVLETQSMLKEQGIPIPEDDYEICRWRFSQPGYMNRKQNDEARMAEKLAQAEAAQAEALSAAQTAADTRKAEIAAAVEAALQSKNQG